jgi:integrase
VYGEQPAKDFGPLALQVVRERMIGEGWSRRYINAQVGRLKRMFKWACSRELIPPSIFEGLRSVDGLRQGKTDAVELEPVKPVPEAWVYAIEDHVSRQVWGMIQLQMFSGMRPGEACRMRGCDIDTTGDVWTYTPERHKTQHHGHKRVIHLGPQSRAVVEEFLKPDTQAYLFSPADAEAERRAKLHEARKLNGTPLSCGNVPGSNMVRKPRRAPKTRYTVASYRRAIARGCELAFPPPAELARQKVQGEKKKGRRWETIGEWRERLGKKWAEAEKWREGHSWHPHQLRHSAATRLRKKFGLEAARVVLGHRSTAVAERYAEIDQDKARQIMGEVG